MYILFIMQMGMVWHKQKVCKKGRRNIGLHLAWQTSHIVAKVKQTWMRALAAERVTHQD